MSFFIFSVNKYFSLGFCEVLKSIGINVTELDRNNIANMVYLKENSVVFLHVNTADEINFLPESLFLKAQIIPVLDSKRGKKNLYLMDKGVLSTSIDIGYLKNIFDYVVYKNKHKNPITLTSIENRVIAYLLGGFSPHEISMRTGISVKTISSHKRNVLTKYGFLEMSTYSIHKFRILKKISLHQNVF